MLWWSVGELNMVKCRISIAAGLYLVSAIALVRFGRETPEGSGPEKMPLQLPQKLQPPVESLQVQASDPRCGAWGYVYA